MKIVFTIAVVFAVWQAFKYLGRLQDDREKRAKVQKRGPKPSQEPPKQSGVEDMVECKVCGAYVTRGIKSCGRSDCPF
ncbi:hypothetical protein V5T82_10365 [Magnetovibrio sp. PR-2]|uniref:hypothetical protein n=1 Tax=Magnetovibrio sp. PR-2 TaxID=3120356 RepID=UPI002FCE26E7